jgi:phosphatidate cytidylyltransferase
MSETASPGKWRDLGARAGVAMLLLPAVVYLIWYGGVGYLALLVVAAGLMALEWCRLIYPENCKSLQTALHALTVLAVILGLMADHIALAIFIGLAGWALSVGLAWKPAAASFPWVWFGVPYLTLPIAALYLLRADPEYGLAAVIWLFVLIWATDTGAYFAGRIIGGPKLAPQFSPKKTWAGLAGGALLAGVASGFVSQFFNLPSGVTLGLLAALAAVISQGGDIFESAAKRRFGVKDSGSILPGHGGILDRVDGLIVAAVFCAALGLARAGFGHAGAGLLVW